MDQALDDYTPKRAASAVRYFFVGVAIFGFLIFSILVSFDCYFTSTICTFLGIACVPVIAVYFLPVILHLSQEEETGPTPQRKAIGIALLVVPYSYAAIYGTLAFLLFISSKAPFQENVQVFDSGKGRGCKHYYSFYEANTQRRLSVCYSKFLFAPYSGEFVVLEASKGPFGIYFRGVERKK